MIGVLGSVSFALQMIPILIDGVLLESDVPAQLIDNRTMAPVRAIAEKFGADVTWNPTSMTVEITSPGKRFLENFSERNRYVITADKLLNQLSTSSAVILDVRSSSLRSEGYITDSVHIPLDELIDRMETLPKDKTIGVYSEKDIHAAYAVTLLNQNHYEAYVLENGIDAWIVAGGNTTWPCEPTG